MRSTLEDRTVIRGRRADPADRLPPNETGLEAQPSRFSAGMWAVILFISSEAFFFGALFTTYFFLSSRIPAWEPMFGKKPRWTVDPILGIGLPTLNTIELLVSSVTMQLAVNAIKRGDRKGLRNWLVPTLVLGVLFLIGQGYEYTRLGFLPRDGIFAGVFFTLTGFHGAHVTGVWCSTRSACSERPRASSRRGAIWPSRPRRSTGTSSTWCGSASSRPSISSAELASARLL